jgi:hypothetical protein
MTAPPGWNLDCVALWHRLSTIWAIYPKSGKVGADFGSARCAIGRVDVRDVSQVERCAVRPTILEPASLVLNRVSR